MEKRDSGDSRLPKSLQAILAAMGAKQRKVFGQYLRFEPFNSQPKLAYLYDGIEAHFFALNRPTGRWEEALDASGINPSQVNKLLTYLHQKLDQFLSIQQILPAPHRHLSYAIEAYTSLKVDDGTIEKKWRQLSKKLQGDPLSIEHMHSMLDLEHFAILARLHGQASQEGSQFTEMHRLIDQHYLLSKLKYCCPAINEAQLVKLPFPTKLTQQVQRLLDDYEGELPALGKAYSMIFGLQMAELQPLENYESILADLMLLQPEIARGDNLDIFNYLLNLCYRRTDSGEPGFDAFVFKVYGQLLEMNLLFDVEIPSRMYRNVVSSYCRQHQFEQCGTFIDKFAHVLPNEDRSILPKHCRGMVHFYQCEFIEATEFFREIIQANPEDHFWAFESRNLLLKSYFQRYETLNQAELDELYRLVDSFKMYVRRNNKLDAYHQQCYLKFIHYLSLLLRHLEEYGDRRFPASLKKAVEEEKIITNKAWLLSLF